MSGQAFFNQWGEAARLVAATSEVPAGNAAAVPPQGREGVFRRVFDSVYEGILLHAADGSILDMNDRFLAMYRVDRERLRTMNIADISSPANPLAALPAIWAGVTAGEQQLFEWKAKRPVDKTTFDVEVFLTRIEMDGQVLILATVRDISDRKRLEEALKRSEERYRLLFDKSPLPKWVFDLETFRILEANDRAREHYGYSREEFLRLTLADIRTPGEFEQLYKWVTTCFSSGEKFEGQVQTKHRKKSGGIIDVDVRYTEIAYKGRRAGLGVMIDVTDRKQTERQLGEAREAAEKRLAEAEEGQRILEAIMEYVPQGLAVGDLSGKVTRSSRYGIELSGMTREEFEGSTQEERRRKMNVYRPDGVTRATDEDMPMVRVLRTGEPVRNWELVIKRKDGREIPILSNAGPIRDRSGAVRGTIHAWTDITDRKRAEEQLKRTIAELKRSNSELQQFAYVASHDLQEPLRTVGSYVELLAMKYRGKLDETADRYISYAVEGANRMSALINDLLAYSRVGTRGAIFSDVDMNSVYRRALESLGRAMRENQAVITADRLPAVRGDESQLRQVLQNLLANAVKFRKPDVPPRIEVSAEPRGTDYVFSVKDNGIGIEPRFFDRIFAIFQRLHTREEYAGTGVGLAICRRIVERHGGRIWVESKPGEGSTFYFSIPQEVRNGEE